MIFARAAAAAVLLLFLVSAPARAQVLEDGGYQVEAVDLPVLGGARPVGLAGAYSSIGTGVAAVAWNPAAASTRERWQTDWFEWDISLGAIFKGRMSTARFFGFTDDSDLNTQSFRFFDVGLRLQFGPAAFAVLVRPRSFTLDRDGRTDHVSVLTSHVDLGWTFLGGQLQAGFGVRTAALSIEEGNRTLLGISGANVELGGTFMPHRWPFRASLVYRAPINATDVEVGPDFAGAYAIPEAVHVPWEVALAATYGFGERPLNPWIPRPPRPRDSRKWRRAHRAAVAAAHHVHGNAPDAFGMPYSPDDVDDATPTSRRAHDDLLAIPGYVAPRRERYGFVSVELILQGRTDRGVGIDGFLAQSVQRIWGDRVTVSPRFGAEGEPWRDRMKLRGGAYVEAARRQGRTPRTHFTSGFDLRLFDTDLFGKLDAPMRFQASFTIDVARGYTSFGVGVGIWH